MIPAPTAENRIRLVLNPSADTSNQTRQMSLQLIVDSAQDRDMTLIVDWGRKLGEIESSRRTAYPAGQDRAECRSVLRTSGEVKY